MNWHEKQIPIATKTPVELRIQAESICDEIDTMMKEEDLGRKKVDNVVVLTSKKAAELLSA